GTAATRPGRAATSGPSSAWRTRPAARRPPGSRPRRAPASTGRAARRCQLVLDPVDVRPGLLEVVVVPDEDGELPGFPLLQLVGAGADRLAAEVLPELLDLLLRHHHQVGDAQVVGERGRDLAEMQLEGVPVGDLAADQVGALAVQHLLAALD